MSLALKKHLKPQVETMIEILGLCEHHYDFLRHLKVYFIQLLEMQSSTFEHFFDHCHTETLQVKVKGELRTLEKHPIFFLSHS